MFTAVLALHNILRWVVLILALIVLIRSYSGWFARREWSPADRKAGMFFTISLDVQLLLGLVLYLFLSPITRAALQDFGAAMASEELRFFALEHLFYMLLAVILAHVGSVAARKAPEQTAKHRRAAFWYTLALAAVLVGMPWWRPLLPGLA